MLSDAHYELAFALRKAKPWKKLYDSQIFAVRHSDGQTSYCSVMGHNGDHLALALYPGESGLHSLISIYNSDYETVEPYLQYETLLSQDCLMVSFQNKSEITDKALDELNAYCRAHGLRLRGANAFPLFERFRPHYYPWHIEDEANQLHMLEGLQAAMDVCRRLETQPPEALGLVAGPISGREIPLLVRKEDGFAWQTTTARNTYSRTYAAAVLTDELALARAKQAKRRTDEWGCAIIMHTEPTAPKGTPKGEQPQSAPFFPYLLLIVSLETGLIIDMFMADNPEDYAPCFTQELLRFIAEKGKPRRLLCKDARTLAFLTPLASRLGLNLKRQDAVEALDDALMKYTQSYSPLAEGIYPDEEDDGEDNDMTDDVALAFLHALITTPEALRRIPDDKLRDLLALATSGLLPFELCQTLRAELERRRKK